jgi:hypothetical protein
MDALVKFADSDKVDHGSVQSIGSLIRAPSRERLRELSYDDKGNCAVAHGVGRISRVRQRLAQLSNSGTHFSNMATVRPRRWPMSTPCVFVAALLLGVACATMPHGASEANLARAHGAAAEGEAWFKEHCADCHGQRGEGVDNAPRILGPGALPEFPRERNLNADPASGDPELLRLKAQTRPAGAPWRDPFRTMQDLGGYVRKHMPLPARAAGSLTDQQYWAIINFMALAHGVAVPPEGINAANASSTKLQVRHP